MADLKEHGLRFNEGKIRYELLEPFAVETLAKVFTIGAQKYSPRNWEKGMSWTSVVASLKRHLSAYEQGVDYDEETKLLHAAHIAWNAMTLLSYYKIAPQFDDRPHKYLSPKKIGLDIDEVICDFTKGWGLLHGAEERPLAWNYDRQMGKRFAEMKQSGTLDSFYLGLEPKVKPEDIPFEPHCYVTSRPVDSSVTEKWLDLHKFPTSKVITVGYQESKAEALKAAGVDVFVDDGFHNFVELNKAGILTYLFDAPHNQRYDVGYKRIKSLKELPI